MHVRADHAAPLLSALCWAEQKEAGQPNHGEETNAPTVKADLDSAEVLRTDEGGLDNLPLSDEVLFWAPHTCSNFLCGPGAGGAEPPKAGMLLRSVIASSMLC